MSLNRCIFIIILEKYIISINENYKIVLFISLNKLTFYNILYNPKNMTEPLSLIIWILEASRIQEHERPLRTKEIKSKDFDQFE